MAAITVTKLNLLGSENRQKNNRPRIGQLGSSNFTAVPFIVNSGNTAATSTDTFTVTLTIVVHEFGLRGVQEINVV